MVNEIPAEIQSSLENNLKLNILTFKFTGGGCINNGGRLAASSGDYFLKWNDAAKFPGMFAAEARGLNLLSSSKGFRIPAVVHHSVGQQHQYLLLEYIKSGTRNPDFWKSFGESLAKLHLNTASKFGLDHNNYIGSLPQRNEKDDDWCIFFIARRLKLQLALAKERQLIGGKIQDTFGKLFLKLPSLLSIERPALLHGDLWSGNLMTDDLGMPVLIDPAVYFGNREVDFAMMQLFGGFDDSYYNSYNAIFPLEKGYKERLELYKLYYLLVHVNLFGTSYLPEVVSILKRFV
jgi:protein-ribulosamine 3-kinase